MPLDGLPSTQERHVLPDFPLGKSCGIAFVGDGPLVHDVEKLRPFVGPGGRVFDAILRSAGVDRKACFVGHVLSTLLEDDWKKERSLRGASWDEFLQRNVLRLQGELTRAKPTVVVPMGPLALLTLAGTPSIAAYRGQPRMGTGAFAHLKVLPTFDPLHVLRQWNFYSIVIGDVVRAVKEVQKGPGLVWPTRILNVAPSIDEVERDLAEWCETSSLLSVDIETGWGQVRGISFARDQVEALYCPFISLASISRSYWYDPETEVRAWIACRNALEHPVPKLGQNFANYDVVWLLGKLGIRPRNVRHDLRLLHKALYPELPASLKFMGSAYSDQGAWKSWASHSGASQRERGEKRDE